MKNISLYSVLSEKYSVVKSPGVCNRGFLGSLTNCANAKLTVYQVLSSLIHSVCTSLLLWSLLCSLSQKATLVCRGRHLFLVNLLKLFIVFHVSLSDQLHVIQFQPFKILIHTEHCDLHLIFYRKETPSFWCYWSYSINIQFNSIPALLCTVEVCFRFQFILNTGIF